MASETSPAGETSSVLHLETRMTMQQAPELLDSLRVRRGRNVELDASGVTTVSTPCLQILLAAADGWRADGRDFRILSPSSDFLMALDHLGIGLEALQSQEQARCP